MKNIHFFFFCCFGCSEEPAYKVKEACKLHCFSDQRPSVSQISGHVFIGNHLPTTGITMQCKDKSYILNTDVPNGAVKFEGACGCKIKNGDITLGRVSSKSCSDRFNPKITALMPIQMTT